MTEELRAAPDGRWDEETRPNLEDLKKWSKELGDYGRDDDEWTPSKASMEKLLEFAIAHLSERAEQLEYGGCRLQKYCRDPIQCEGEGICLHPFSRPIKNAAPQKPSDCLEPDPIGAEAIARQRAVNSESPNRGDGWISVKDRTPEQNWVRVLAYSPRMGQDGDQIWPAIGDAFRSEDWLKNYNVTHWMPLPAAPI